MACVARSPRNLGIRSKVLRNSSSKRQSACPFVWMCSNRSCRLSQAHVQAGTADMVFGDQRLLGLARQLLGVVAQAFGR